MWNILSDFNKFFEICIAKEKYLNFLINMGKQITNLLEQLNASQIISDTEFKNLKPRRSRFGILYSLCKIHKSLFDNCPPLWPILWAVKILSEKWFWVC